MNDKWFLGARRVFFALFACWVTLPAFATHRALVEETADAVKVGNGSVELIVPKGKAFNIQSMKLNDGEEWSFRRRMPYRGYSLIKVFKEKIPCCFPNMESIKVMR